MEDGLEARLAAAISENVDNVQATRNAIQQHRLLSGFAGESSAQGAILESIGNQYSSKKVKPDQH